MKSIKYKILVGMLSVVLLGSTLIGIITALLNAGGIDTLMQKTLGPATHMAAEAVQWKMDNRCLIDHIGQIRPNCAGTGAGS